MKQYEQFFFSFKKKKKLHSETWFMSSLLGHFKNIVYHQNYDFLKSH